MFFFLVHWATMEYKNPEILLGPAYCSSAHIPEKQTAAFCSHVWRSTKSQAGMLCVCGCVFGENRKFLIWLSNAIIEMFLSGSYVQCSQWISFYLKTLSVINYLYTDQLQYWFVFLWFPVIMCRINLKIRSSRLHLLCNLHQSYRNDHAEIIFIVDKSVSHLPD